MKQEGERARAAGTHQDTLKSTKSSTRQPTIGQCAGKGTIERMARGHEIEIITSDACARRASEPPESTATRGIHTDISTAHDGASMMSARANRGGHGREGEDWDTPRNVAHTKSGTRRREPYTRGSRIHVWGSGTDRVGAGESE